MRKPIETYIVDSFTDKQFKGNPAGVCILKDELQDEQMLSIAKEFGFSETSFIRNIEGTNKYTIRFFSPKMEIPLCGHATLASAKVVFEKSPHFNEIHFITTQNIDLIIHQKNDNIIMEFPVYETTPQKVSIEILNSLGIIDVINSAYNKETSILLLEIADSVLLEKLTPDFHRLKHSNKLISGVLVTAKSKRKNYDFESRYFWPRSGTDEDPVTGGTHTFLTKYWSERLNKKKMHSFQCSKRTGFMVVELIGNNKLTITSKAQIVLEGKLRI